MHVESIQLENYKTFFEEQRLTLEHGFNLLVGANNAGKTSILEALDLDPSLSHTHRSIRSAPNYGDLVRKEPRVRVAIRTDARELASIADGTLHLPLREEFVNQPRPALFDALRPVLTSEAPIVLSSTFGAGKLQVYMDAPPVVSGGMNSQTADSGPVAIVTGGASQDAISVVRTDLRGALGRYHDNLRNRIYRFNAQRRPGFASSAGSPMLDRDAQGLPFCINHLQTMTLTVTGFCVSGFTECFLAFAGFRHLRQEVCSRSTVCLKHQRLAGKIWRSRCPPWGAGSETYWQCCTWFLQLAYRS